MSERLERTPDFIDKVRESWSTVLPEIDTSSLDLIGRINRISSHATHLIEQVLEPSGVTRSEFDVLSALGRADRPLRAGELTAQTMLSSAATTKLTSRLAAAGYITRERPERDGRGVLLQLTDAGRALIASAFPQCVEVDERLIGALTPTERETLSALLRKVSTAASIARGVPN